MSPRNGLLGLCLLAMGLFTLYQQLSIAFAVWAVALVAGAVLGWMIGSGAWRSVGADLVAALLTVCCVLFGSVLPLLSLYKTSPLIVGPAALGLVLAVVVGRRVVRPQSS